MTKINHINDNSPPVIDHWAMLRALVVLILINSFSIGFFYGVYMAYMEKPSLGGIFLFLVTPLLLLILLWLQDRQRRRLGLSWATIGFQTPRRSLLHLLWQVPVALTLLALVYKLCGKLGNLSLMPPFKPLAPWWIYPFCIVLLVPIAEEIAFRGLFFIYLRRYFGRGGVLGISSLVFALVHWYSGLPLLPYYLLMGLIFGYVRLQHRNLWASVILHALLNLTVIIATLANVLYLPKY